MRDERRESLRKWMRTDVKEKMCGEMSGKEWEGKGKQVKRKKG